MQDIQSIPGKLFYQVYQMYKQNTIDAKAKQILKDLIIMNNSQVMKAYQEYVKSGTQLTLRNDLFRIYKSQRELQKIEGLSDRSRKSKGPKAMHIIIPAKNIQKIPAHMRAT